MSGRARPRATYDPAVSGQAFGIRGAATKGKASGPMPVADLIRNGANLKGKGRVPGGGGGADSGHRMPGNNASQITTGRSIATLKKFLASRWMADSRFLKLDAMAADPILAEEGLKPPGTPGAHKDLGSVMWKLSREMFSEVRVLGSKCRVALTRLCADHNCLTGKE